jgi:hypothetical protein
MSGEIVKGSIEITKLKKPVKAHGETYHYEVDYISYPYGAGSVMRKRESILAFNKKDADAWKKTLLKDVV